MYEIVDAPKKTLLLVTLSHLTYCILHHYLSRIPVLKFVAAHDAAYNPLETLKTHLFDVISTCI